MSIIMRELFEKIRAAGFAVSVGLAEEFRGKVDPDYIMKLARAPKQSLKTLIDDYLQ